MGEADGFGAEVGEGVAVWLVVDEVEEECAAAAARDSVDYVLGVDFLGVAVGGECEGVGEVVFGVVDGETAVGEAVGSSLKADGVDGGGEVAGAGDAGWFDNGRVGGVDDGDDADVEVAGECAVGVGDAWGGAAT